MRNRIAAVCLILAWFSAAPAGAVAVDPPLPDPALEARAQDVFKDLRCLVCQNQSIADSNADLARDLRVIVRERLAAGDSDKEAREYLVARYGDWVLLSPPVKLATMVLWLGPLILLLIAGFAVRRYYRHSAATVEAPAPLSEEERQQLEKLRREGG